jgi:hypothetical protein
MDIAQIELQIAGQSYEEKPKNICLGCNKYHETELAWFNHTIQCDKYYQLDKTNKELHNYCLEQSKNGKVIIINQDLLIDFNYVKKNIYRCRHADSEYFASSTLQMNNNMKKIYSDVSIIILSDCISTKDIVEIIKKIEK